MTTTLVKGWHVVTMNARRDVIRDGAVLIEGDRIVSVGKARDLEAQNPEATVVGGDRFVVTPGLVNTHIHITGEPLTRGYVPDDTPFEENVFVWLCPLYAAYTAEEERLSGQLAAVEMLKSGTTTFLEAGTIRFLDEVVDGLTEVGIRGRVGRWVWVMFENDDTVRVARSAAPMLYPELGEGFAVSGSALHTQKLAGQPAAVDEPYGDGRVVLFPYNLNFRLLTQGTQRILWNAVLGPDPS